MYLITHDLAKNSFKLVVLDPNIPCIDEARFNLDAYWKEFYGYEEEEDLRHVQKPLGKPVIISAFVHADHAGHMATEVAYMHIDLC